MRNRRRRSPRLEALESLTLMSSGSAPANGPHAAPRGVTPAIVAEAKVPNPGSRSLDGTLRGTFFAHRGSPGSGTIYSLFASGKIGPTGPTLLVGGFQRSGFTARGAGGGNVLLNSESH